MAILVTGATGVVGRHVVDQLLQAGQRVRALTRNPDKAGLPAGVEVIAGDLEKPDTLEGVFDGVERVYLFPNLQAAPAVVKLAKQAGVRRIVLLSSLSAGDRHDYNAHSSDYHRAIEQVVEASGIEWTHVRPGMFAGNVELWAYSIQSESVARGPYAASAQAPVHEADIAAVAVAALIGDGHTGKVYTVTGPQALTQVELAATIGAAIGRPVRFEELTPQQWVESVSGTLEDNLSMLPQDITSMLLGYWETAVHTPDPVLPTVEQVTGRQPRTFAQWAADNAGTFA